MCAPHRFRFIIGKWKSRLFNTFRPGPGFERAEIKVFPENINGMPERRSWQNCPEGLEGAGAINAITTAEIIFAVVKQQNH
jgi:hypothetical protein